MFSSYDIFTGLADVGGESVPTTWEGTNADGEPIIHSTLTNPLPSNLGGTFARRLRHTSQGDQFNTVDTGDIIASINGSVASGGYLAPDNTKALDLRFTVRDEDQNPQHQNIGVANRYFADTGHPTNGGPCEGFDGYGMRFGPIRNFGSENHDGNGNLPAHRYVGLWARHTAPSWDGDPGTPHATESNVDVNPVTNGPWLPQTWYRFRYKFLPTTDLLVTLIAQVLNAITADETVESNWVEITRLTLTAALDLPYVPFQAGQRVGFYTSRNGNQNGFPNMFLDNFAAARATVGS